METATEENGTETTPEETGGSGFQSIDEVVVYVNQSIAELKKLIQPSKETPTKIDDFKLLKQQQDANLEAANQRIAQLESQFNDMADGFKNQQPSRTNLEAIWDFLFKP